MSSFKNFLLEASVTPFDYQHLSIERVVDLLHTHYSKAWTSYLEDGQAVYRGWKREIKLGVYSPSSGTRKSQNTGNYYTKLFDTNPANTNNPQRSKSFICSTNADTAINFSTTGENTTSLIIPINTGKYGVVPAFDLWNVKLPRLQFQNFYYDELNNFCKDIFGDDAPSYDEFVRKLDSIKKDDDDYKILQVLLQYKTDVFQFIEVWKDVYTYDKHGFSIEPAGSFLPANVEVWTDSDCVVIPMLMLQDVKLRYISKYKSKGVNQNE